MLRSLLLVTLILTLLGRAEENQPPTPEACAGLAKRLTSEDFETRDSALKELSLKGLSWIEAMEKAAPKEDVELIEKFKNARSALFNTTLAEWRKILSYKPGVNFTGEKEVTSFIESAAPLKALLLKLSDKERIEFWELTFKMEENVVWYWYARQKNGNQNPIYKRCLAVFNECTEKAEKYLEKHPDDTLYADLLKESNMLMYASRKSILIE